MPNIKELAAKAGVSPSTASIVVNGKSKERKISQETQDKIWKAAKEIGYRPNISARRLRDQNTTDSITIAVFWSSDVRSNLMTRFLHGLQDSAIQSDKTIEFLIHPYKNNQLHEVATIPELAKYHAVIICNASTTDLVFLEQMNYPVPIILYNRKSESYPYVCVDDSLIGKLAGEVFISHQRHKALLLGDESLFPGLIQRINGFLAECDKGDIAVSVINCDMTMKDGYDKMIHFDPSYDCIFALSDYQAIGVLRYCLQHQIPIPDKVELISVGNADHELEEYAAIPLSVIELPMENMAKECLNIALSQIEMNEGHNNVILPVRYIARETTSK